MAGELADGWSASIPHYLPYERVAGAQRLVDEGARAAGRDPRSVLRICNIPGTITDRDVGSGQLSGSEPLRGGADRWIEVLSDWTIRLRFDVFILWPEVETPEQVERFARDVAPACGLLQGSFSSSAAGAPQPCVVGSSPRCDSWCRGCA